MHLSRCAAVAALTAALLLPTSLPAQAAPAASPEAKPAARAVRTPTLEARATLSADYQAKGPASGAKATPANGRKGPWPGQVIPGFSAMVANSDGTFWAMPDNGFGTKANSDDFLLRIYRVKPRWESRYGGPGTIAVQKFVSLRDPKHLLDFDIVNERTKERLLTGADFDVESLVRLRDGSFWIGEEFGPFLLHFSASGVLLEAPIRFPHGQSPSSPLLKPGQEPAVRNSKGFEALAASPDGRTLYPILEGYLAADGDKRLRRIYEFDVRGKRYTGRTWKYRADAEDNLVGDAFWVRRGRLLILERDDFWGPQSVTKRVYAVNLAKTERDRYLAKELVVDLLKVANPGRIGERRDAGAYGVGDPFSFPMQSVETVVQLADGRLLIANDNNYPGNDARRPGTPDDTELIVVDPNERRSVRGNGATVIAHRGASGYRPEHTLAAYEEAIKQCADFIEPDLVMTKDGVLVDRHENEIGGTTDVATRPEFAGRKTSKTIDGATVTGWFTEDFTLAELRTLRARERLGAVRPGSAAFDGLYQVPTFDEVLDLARHSRTCDGRVVGIIPEIKHPSYFDGIGLSMEEGVVEALDAKGYGRRDSRSVIQSFEVGNLKELRGMTDAKLVQLINCSGAPYDLKAAGSPITYADMVTRKGLREIARYSDQVSFCKDVMIPRHPDGTLAAPTAVIADAHAAGLTVVGWTFRAENQFLPAEFRSGSDPAALGDMAGEIRAFLDAGMDDFFTDHPDLGVRAARRR